MRVDLSATCQTSRPDRDRRLNECHIRRSAAFAMAGDAEVARMRASGVPFRAIAAAMGMSLGGVQKSVRRAQKVADALATGSPGDGHCQVGEPGR